MKTTVVALQEAKQKKEKFSMLTAYDYTTARLMDQAGIQTILVGDSLGMVMLGYEDTLSVTMEDMIHHCKAVARGAQKAMVICDMPFLSYQTSVYDAVLHAGQLVKEGHAQAVKLEGGLEVCPQVKAIAQAGIPVMAHIGLTPQAVHVMGGFRVQGRTQEAAKKLLQEAKALEEAGAFAVLLECVPAKLASLISETLSVPTVGIGAGNGCDGQVLVYQDMLGMYDKMTPKFVKVFEQAGELMQKAFRDYHKEVQSGQFPAEEHTFAIRDDVLEKLY